MSDDTESEHGKPNRDTWNLGNPEVDEAAQWLANLRSLFLEAETLNFSYREEEALRLYNRLVQQDADSLYGHLAAGQIAISHGSTESALDEFLLAKQVEDELLRTGILDNQVDSTSIHLGLTYRKLRKYEEAIEALASVNPPNRRNPNPFAYAAQASVYRAILTDAKHNRLPNAEQESVRKQIEHFVSLALSIDPKLSYAQSILVKLYQEQGQQDPKQLNTVYDNDSFILQPLATCLSE